MTKRLSKVLFMLGVTSILCAGGLVLAAQPSVAAASCKPCKGRTWCHCSYNGLPRVSCNPCCYGNLGIPQVCLD